MARPPRISLDVVQRTQQTTNQDATKPFSFRLTLLHGVFGSFDTRMEAALSGRQDKALPTRHRQTEKLLEQGIVVDD